MCSMETVNLYFIQCLSPIIKMICFSITGIILSHNKENRGNHIQSLDSTRISKLIDYSGEKLVLHLCRYTKDGAGLLSPSLTMELLDVHSY